MKFAISLFTTLVIIIGAVLFIQYQVYSDHVESGNKEFNYSQEIEVVIRENSYDIRHHFNQLPDGTVKIQLPAKAIDVDCFLETENSCDRLDVSGLVIQPGKIKAQSISYVVPLEKELKQATLFKDIFAALNAGNASYTTLHITTKSNIKGSWVTNLPLIGKQQLSLVNYTKFRGKGNITELYWDPRTLNSKKINDSIAVYSEKELNNQAVKDIASIAQLDDSSHLTIVQSGLDVGSSELVFMNEISPKKIEEMMLMSQLQTMYQLDEKTPYWVKEVLLAYLTGREATNAKAKEIVKTVDELLSKEQAKEWKKGIEEAKGKPMSVEKLDELLSNVLANHTTYFVKNSQAEGNYPFYYSDARDIYFNNKPQKSFEMIYYEGKVLFKAEPLLTALGYNAYEGENGYYVNNETRVFRFPENHGFYVYNQRRYNTASDPFVKIQNEYYIEEVWMQRLFLVEVSKKEDEVSIKTIQETQ